MARCLRHRAAGDFKGMDVSRVLEGCEGLELADSITGDAHKLLNVVSHPIIALQVIPRSQFDSLMTADSSSVGDLILQQTSFKMPELHISLLHHQATPKK